MILQSDNGTTNEENQKAKKLYKSRLGFIRYTVAADWSLGDERDIIYLFKVIVCMHVYNLHFSTCNKFYILSFVAK